MMSLVYAVNEYYLKGVEIFYNCRLLATKGGEIRRDSMSYCDYDKCVGKIEGA